ncbi:hypothetical protein AB0F91_44165 [Amycolatopsis sp. NPDC023774]
MAALRTEWQLPPPVDSNGAWRVLVRGLPLVPHHTTGTASGP